MTGRQTILAGSPDQANKSNSEIHSLQLTAGMWSTSPTNDWLLLAVPWLQLLVFSTLGIFFCCGKKPKTTEAHAMKSKMAPPPPAPAPKLWEKSKKEDKTKADEEKKATDHGTDDKEEQKELEKKEEEKKADERKDAIEKLNKSKKEEEKKAEDEKKDEKKEIKQEEGKKDRKIESAAKKKEEKEKTATEEKESKKEEKEERKASEAKKASQQEKKASQAKMKSEGSQVKKKSAEKEDPPPPSGAKRPKPSADTARAIGLELNTTELRWEFNAGQQTFKVTNQTGKRMAYKVKTTDASIYSVTPVYGFLEDKAHEVIAAVRKEAPMKEDHIVVVYGEAEAADKEPQEVFKKKDVGQHHVMIKMLKK